MEAQLDYSKLVAGGRQLYPIIVSMLNVAKREDSVGVKLIGRALFRPEYERVFNGSPLFDDVGTDTLESLPILCGRAINSVKNAFTENLDPSDDGESREFFLNSAEALVGRIHNILYGSRTTVSKER